MVNPLFLPRSREVFLALYEGFAPDGVIRAGIFHSPRLFSIGMIAAAVVGIPVGLGMGASTGVRWLESKVAPWRRYGTEP